MAKTYVIKPAEVTRKWYVIDASEVPLGRMSTMAARLLIGKDKPSVTPHVDGGDYVVIINAGKLKITGDKMQKKMYYNHSGYPSGLRSRRMEEVMVKDPAEVIILSIRGMLPVNKLRAGRLERLKVYVDDQHPHAPQQPEIISLKKKGSK